MGVFRDAEELYRCIGGLFDKATTDDGMGRKVGESNIIIRFEYADPEAILTIDAKSAAPVGKFFRTIRGENDLKPDVRMTMRADVAHQFWLGKINLTAALSRKQIIAYGPLTVIMKLLPVIKPAYKLYHDHLRELGRDDLLEV